VFDFSSIVYGGLALQQTKPYQQANVFEPGVVGGVSLGNFDIPFYCFSPFGDNKNFVLGINWQWQKK
jgi:hypothetical protein